MPVVFVYGLPEDMHEEEIESLYKKLAQAIVRVEELNLGVNQIAFFFPPDRMSLALGSEIIIFVKGLLEKPERTDEVRAKLAENLRLAAQEFFPNATLVECFIEPFNPCWGFSSSWP